jgi:YVTN family beta-propeller protein
MRVKVALLSGLAAAVSLPAMSAQASTTPGSHGSPAVTIAAEPGTLPITNFHQFVVDAAHGHLFFTQGYSSTDGFTKHNAITVTNLSGHLVTTITGQDDVQGIALSPDGSTLYAADEGDDAVSAISTTTLKETARYSLGTGNAPYGVAVQSGMIWVGYGSSTGGMIGEINPTPPGTFTPQVVSSVYSPAPDVRGDPSDGGTLLASDSYDTIDWATFGSYNVAATPPTIYQPPSTPGSCQAMVSYAVIPGGADFVAACSGSDSGEQPPTAATEYNSQTFAQAGSYKTGAPPAAVAVAPGGSDAGTVAAGAGQGPGIAVYPPGAKTPVNEYAVPGSQIWLVNDGLAFSPDGSALYAVYQDGGGAPGTTVHFFLRVYRNPTVTASAIKLSGPAKVVRGHRVTISGKLTLTVGQAAAGSRITITRKRSGSSSVTRWTRTTGSHGVFSLTDTPPDLGTYTYTATYAGTATRQATAASHAVNVTRIPSSLGLSASGGTVSYRAAVKVTAHLGRTYNSRTVRIYAKAFGARKAVLIKTGRTNSRGDLTVSYRPARSTIFSATFAGDAKYQPATAAHRVFVRAGVTEQIKGYYASETIGSTLYRIYHATSTLTSTVAVAPNKKGGCVAFEVQQYYQGSWQANTMSSCQVLGSSSRTSIRYRLNGAVGGQFRIRGDFNRKNGDITNVNASSGWAYFTVTS